MKIFFQHQTIFGLLFVAIILTAPHGASGQHQPELGDTTDGSSRQLIQSAAQAVDEAWEEFHQAAIGGTLASPDVQTKIEGQLHEARDLLMEARKAERSGDHRSVKIITDKLFELSHEIVMASREKKR